MLNDSAWPDLHTSELKRRIRELASQQSATCTSRTSKCAQEFPSFESYFTQELLDDVRADAPLRHKMQRASSHLIRLGVRQLAEPSWRHVCAVLCVLSSEGAMTPAQRFGALTDFKNIFKNQLKGYPPPVENIRDFPRSIDDFRTNFPNTYLNVFGETTPVPTDIDVTVLRTTEAQTPLRRSKTSLLRLPSQAHETRLI